MSTLILHLILGLALGAGLGLAHGWSARRAAAQALESGSSLRLLLGFPLRVAVPAAGLFALSLVSVWALAAGLVAFLGVQLLQRRRALS